MYDCVCNAIKIVYVIKFDNASFSEKITLTIEGYVEALNEGDDLSLTCKVTPASAQLNDAIIITFTQEGLSVATLMTVGRTYAKSNVTTADAGEYRCEAGELRDNVTVIIRNTQESGNLAAQSKTQAATLAPIIGISVAAFIAFLAATAYLLYRKVPVVVYEADAGRYCYYKHNYFSSFPHITNLSVFILQI